MVEQFVEHQGTPFRLRPRPLAIPFPDGVIGNTTDSGSVESWFEPRLGSFLNALLLGMWDLGNVKRISDGDYDAVLLPQHPNADKNGHVAMHRAVMENRIGRLLTTDEHVHHINENKKDNEDSNLELLTKSEHAKRHARPKTMVLLICSWCDVPFEREKRLAHEGVPAYCGREHQHAALRHRELPHGYGRYRKGCKCAICRKGNADRTKRSRDRLKK